MSTRKLLMALLTTIFVPLYLVQAQEEEFDFSAFEEADDTKVVSFCNNKVINLSPTKLVSLSYDVVGGFDMSQTGIIGGPITPANFNANHGVRLDANFPIISDNKIIVNATVRYWESRYNLNESNGNALAFHLDQLALRTSTVGLVVFKPLNDRHFLLFQMESALNGNYNFSDISPDFGEMKIGGAALFGWKTNDYTNVAVGVTRTFRGGRVLHIPVLMYNKTYNNRWGIEALLPAYGFVRRNFSTKSILKLGFELEGQSYYLQNANIIYPDFNPGGVMTAPRSAELRKSEIRPRISWDVALSDFIWVNLQAGVRMNYRFDVDVDAGSTEPFIENDIGIPFYFGFGINLASP